MNQAAIDQPRPADGYAGDISPQLAWQWASSGQAVLVDVRSDAERDWVGHVPGALAVVWKQWPGMRLNIDFDAQLCAAVPPGTKALLLCRSGVRSIAAARRATELGLQAYNLLEASRATPTRMASATAWAAGAFMACRGGRGDDGPPCAPAGFVDAYFF